MEKQKFLMDYALQCIKFNCSAEVALFIASQFALESNFGRSDIAKENCNICGMLLSRFRITTALWVNRGHAVYLSTLYCVIDYFLWLSRFDFNQRDLVDLECFKTRLQKSNYCPSKRYIDSIESIYDTYSELLTNLKLFKDGKQK